MILLDSNEKILVIGHRGANNIAPENTLKSFKKAIELGADYIEFDIHQSKDGEIVIMHDANTYNTTGHKGLIKRMTLKELKELDCGEGERIPTLQELIKIAKYNIGLQIEIKAKGMAEKLVELLRKEDLIESSIISSFLHEELLNIQKIEPKLKLATLEPIISNPSKNWDYHLEILNKVINNKYFAIHPRYQLVNKRLINYAHDNNIKVNIWTVNSKAWMKKFIKKGVDGLITDNIQNAKDVLKR